MKHLTEENLNVRLEYFDYIDIDIMFICVCDAMGIFRDKISNQECITLFTKEKEIVQNTHLQKILECWSIWLVYKMMLMLDKSIPCVHDKIIDTKNKSLAIWNKIISN